MQIDLNLNGQSSKLHPLHKDFLFGLPKLYNTTIFKTTLKTWGIQNKFV